MFFPVFLTPKALMMCSLISHYFKFRMISNLPLKIFGCLSFVHIHSHERGELEPRAAKCVFAGYSHTKKGTIILPLVKHIFQLMKPLLKVKIIFQVLIFKGSNHSRTIRTYSSWFKKKLRTYS